MKVKELIALLQQQDPEARVVVQGYEGGYNDAATPEPIRLKLNVHPKEDWYYGPHDEDRKGRCEAVLIKRGVTLT